MLIFILLFSILGGAAIGLSATLWWSFWAYLVTIILSLIAPSIFSAVAFGVFFHVLGAIFIPLGIMGGLIISSLVLIQG